jgi:hypothetical protein
MLTKKIIQDLTNFFYKLVYLIMKKTALLLTTIFCFGLSSCTDQAGATRTLLNSGYTNIKITGYRFFMKGKDDVYCTGFEADSPNGNRVTGAVTRGWFKGNTVRLD